MSTNKFGISSHLSGSLILSAAMFFSWPLSAQTSETSATASQSSESKDTEKAKRTYSVDDVPEDASAPSVSANNDQLKSFQEKIRRLEKENAQLRAELKKLRAKN